jgi:hypothetical protein
MNATREDHLLFAEYSDQIERSVRNEVDAVCSYFPSRQLTPEQQRAIAAYDATAPARRAILEKAGRITITEAPANDLGVRPGESSPERMLGNVLAVLIVILACVVVVIIKACEGAK